MPSFSSLLDLDRNRIVQYVSSSSQLKSLTKMVQDVSMTALSTDPIASQLGCTDFHTTCLCWNKAFHQGVKYCMAQVRVPEKAKYSGVF